MAPKEIEFDQDLPLTQSGKVMRRVLKARELGLDTGDVSTLGGATMSRASGQPVTVVAADARGPGTAGNCCARCC